MELEFEMPLNWQNKSLVVCCTEEPVPVGFMNVYEDGDIWVKTVGCEGCSYENRTKCCGGCPMHTEKGCFFHMDKIGPMNKPFHCVASPNPKDCTSYCQQEFKCVRGTFKGTVRKISLPADIFL